MDSTIVSLPASQLSGAHIARWSELQRQHPRFAGPYFRPEFTLAVSEVCNNVEVAVFESSGEPVGFFPYQRVRRRHAQSIGGIVSDYQGVIIDPAFTFSPEQLLDACGLVTWHFTHLVADQPEFENFHCFRAGSSYLDLSRGFDVYFAQRNNTSSKRFFRRILREARYLENDFGPLRYEFQVTDANAFDTLIAWKTKQYRRTRTLDIFQLPWTRPLLERIFATRQPEFGGWLSAMYAGDRLVSVDFGMRAGPVLHGWITARDPSLSSRYSPGHALLLEIARYAAEQGIERIDLGKGLESYKCHWTSGESPLAEGVVDLRPMARLVKQTWIRSRERIRASRLYGTARRVREAMQPLSAWLKVRDSRCVYKAAPAEAPAPAVVNDVAMVHR